MQNISKTTKEKRIRVHKRIRSKISGTEQKPRLSIFKSNNHIYAQAIDDENQKTLVSSSDLEIKDVKSKKTDKSTLVAQKLAEKLKAKKISEIVFVASVTACPAFLPRLYKFAGFPKFSLRKGSIAERTSRLRGVVAA